MLPIIVSLSAGLLFGLGLAISDMMNPQRVLNFFDVAGSWDPTLIFVMLGALGVTAAGYRLVFRLGKPLLGANFNLPTAKRIELPMIAGAAVFGVGWGIAGFCPGPAIAAMVSLEPKAWVFVIALAAGMVLADFWQRTRSKKQA